MGAQTVTVVIVNWNCGALLADCLEHLFRQTRPATRILVMDNGSTDGSAECVKRFPGVGLRRLGRNLGFAKANNLAFAEIDTEYVALLNADAQAEPDWLERLLAAAQAHPDMVAFGSRQMAYDSTEILDGLGDVYHFSGLAWRKGFGRRIVESDLTARSVFAVCGAAALYRREALLRVGGFDESYFCYFEDVDLGFRLLLMGLHCQSVPDAVVHHRGGASNGGHRSDFSVYHGHRNLVWTFVKDMPGALFWLLLPAHVLQTLAVIVCFAAGGRGHVILRAKWDALKGIRRAWRQRGRIQAQRVASIGQIWRAMDYRILPTDRIRVRKALHLSA